MPKKIIVAVALLCVALQTHAFPVEAFTSFFAKLFKGGTVAKEAVTAERVAEGAKVGTLGANGVNQLRDADGLVRSSTAKQISNHQPDFTKEPLANDRQDALTYKKLRDAAAKGDSNAMLQMAKLTSSGKVSDLGEPYPSYWLIQSARLGNQLANQHLRSECSTYGNRRKSDAEFDSACVSTAGGKSLYQGTGDVSGSASNTLKK